MRRTRLGLRLLHTGALVRELPKSFAAQSLRTSQEGGVIDHALAATQHTAYVSTLQSLLPPGSVRVLPALEECADCVFIEDTVVVLNGKALLTRPGAASRRGEVGEVEGALKALGIPAVTVQAPGTLDGGDVLWTGREFFCGLSRRTNALGVEALRGAFPGARVTPVPLQALARASARQATARLAHPTAAATALPEDTPTPTAAALHLKSIASRVGPTTLAVADTPLGRAVASFIQEHSGVPKEARAGGHKLSFLLIPAAQAGAANAVLVNDTTLMVQKGGGKGEGVAVLKAFAEAEGLKVVEVDTSELAKADGALSCCSVLL